MSEEEKKQQETPDPKGGAHIAKSGGKTASAESAEPDKEAAQPKRNKYADKMNRKKRRLSRGMQIGIAVVVLALFLGLGIFFVLKTRSGGADEAANQIAVATRGMLETYIEGNGVTAAKKREELGRDLKGTVRSVMVEVGDEVKQGDTLVVVDPVETRKELETVQTELAEAQAEVTKARDAVTAAQKRLSRLSVTAPFTGKIIPVTDAEGNSTTYRVGQQISEGETIGYMVDDNHMKLSLYFSSAYSSSIKSGQTATISIPSAMSTVSGKVDAVESAQKISGEGVKMFRVVITMDNPGTLTKGMMATATVSAGTAGEVYPAESGSLEYGREEAVTAQVGGEIKTLGGIDYYHYSSGATIMTLTSETAQEELQAAQNGVTTAQRQVQSKQERINELRKLITDANIKSPIDGVVVNLNAYEENEVTGTEPLVVVADLNDIIVNADIMATDVSLVQPGQFAMMNMYTNDGSLTLTGIVESVALEPSQNSDGGQGSMATFPAVIAIDPIEGQSISIGMGVDYKITTASSMDCLMVPSSAVVYTEDGGTAVFAKPPVDENGEEIPFMETLPIPEGTEGIPADFQLVPVEVGISDSVNTEIYWGIDEGTTVYLAGPQDLDADMGMDMGMESAIAVG